MKKTALKMMPAGLRPELEPLAVEYATPVEIQLARNEYQTDECEIDDNAHVSRADDESGRWVAAWVWVSSEELPL